MKKKVAISKCKSCGKILTQREIIFARGLCSDCFFKTRHCVECGRQIIPYKEGYTKCKRCFLRDQRASSWSSKPESLDIHKSFKNFSNDILDFAGKIITYLIIVMFISGLVFPLILFGSHSDMQYVIGNPRPFYFYDISDSCKDYDSSIVYSLESLSKETGVKFFRLPSPLALIAGGISYDCSVVMTNVGAAGEAESGIIGISWIVIAWNKIRLVSIDPQTILHETLHTMGFGHSQNPGSIMYQYNLGGGLDTDTISFVKKMYGHNIFAYLNIIPLNLLYVLIVALLIFGGIIKDLLESFFNLFRRR